MRVAICITTLNRPEGLRRTLTELNRLTFRDREPDIELVVVDNDVSESSKPVCEEMRSILRWPLAYAVEPNKGIPFARNTAVKTAGIRAEWVALIDDDEVPEPHWLDELVRVQAATSADVVAAPVFPRFAEGAPDWIVRGGFFNPRRHQTGEVLVYAYGGNVMFRTAICHEAGIWFAERYGLMGCDDSEFFPRAHRAGYKIVWADDATVHEFIPAARANFKWLIQRMYRVGNSCVFVAMDLDPHFKTRLLLLAKAGAWLAIGAVNVVVGLVAGKHILVRGARFVVYGWGLLTGLFGKRYEEYRSAHR